MKMTRADLVTALQYTGLATDAASLVQQKNALDTAYLWVWNASGPGGVPLRWSFEQADQADLAVVAADSTPTMPSDLGEVQWITDNFGERLAEIDPERFDATFGFDAANATVGAPIAYKIVNRQITFGPTPAASATFKVSYRRRVSHYNNSDVATGGTFTADTDYPLWPDHHMILVYHAAAILHGLRSNPAAVTMQGLRDDALDEMRNDLQVEVASGQVWGAPTPYGWGR